MERNVVLRTMLLSSSCGVAAGLLLVLSRCCPRVQIAAGWVEDLEKKMCRIGLHVHAVHVLPLERIVSYGNELHGYKFNINALNVLHVHLQEKYICTAGP
jgi:hypothetical protein